MITLTFHEVIRDSGPELTQSSSTWHFSASEQAHGYADTVPGGATEFRITNVASSGAVEGGAAPRRIA